MSNVLTVNSLLRLDEFNCDECSSNHHATGAHVICPSCRYEDETNMGTDYDYLYGDEFLDSYCRNCGIRLQATFRLSRSWITHEVYPKEIADKWIADMFAKGKYKWDYTPPVKELSNA